MTEASNGNGADAASPALQSSIDKLRARDNSLAISQAKVEAAIANAVQIAIRELGQREHLTPGDMRLQKALIATIHNSIRPIDAAQNDYAPQTQADTPMSDHALLMEGITQIVATMHSPATMPSGDPPKTPRGSIDPTNGGPK
jgi:hypothetical protein